MPIRWLNNGEPDADGIVTVQLLSTEGAVASTFKGTSRESLVDPLLVAQENANRRLGQLLGKPDKANPPQPPPYTEAERVKYATGVSDPSAVVETVTEIATRQQRTQEERDAYDRAEAIAFTEAHPDYYRTTANQTALFRALIERGYDLTRNNLAIVYEELLAKGLIELDPEKSPTPVEGADDDSTPLAVPRSRASGLRNSDASAMKPQPPPKKPVVTWPILDKMSRAEYSERLRDPVFRRAVDELPPRGTPQAVGAR